MTFTLSRMRHPLSDEVASCLCLFLRNGMGPKHTELGDAFLAAGVIDAAPHEVGVSKAARMQAAACAAMKNPVGAKTFLERVLDAYRLADVFTNPEYADNVAKLRSALARQGWGLSDDGRLEPLGDITLDTHDREALEEQLDRLRRNTEDAGLLLGAAKDLLESVGKYVLEESGQLPTRRMDFP